MKRKMLSKLQILVLCGSLVMQSAFIVQAEEQDDIILFSENQVVENNFGNEGYKNEELLEAVTVKDLNENVDSGELIEDEGETFSMDSFNAYAVPDSGETVLINETFFPDEVFRQYIKNNYDYNGDGILSTEEISSVKQMQIDFQYDDNGEEIKIHDLAGIKFFINLEKLYLWGGLETSHLDLSGMPNLANLIGGEGGVYIEELDLSNNNKLISIECPYGNMINLDVCGCENLQYLNCEENNLKKLDLSDCTKLKGLMCGNNSLGKLDLTNCVNLETLSCCGNLLSELDLSNNRKLYSFDCSNNKLSSLDLGNCYELEFLDCSNNQLTYLDLSNQFNMRDVDCVIKQKSTSGALKTENGWLVNVGALVGINHLNSVILQNGWIMQEDGYAFYQGTVLPENLYYACDTQCPSTHINLPVMVSLHEGICNHNYEKKEVPATCTQKGEKKFICSICGKIKEGSTEEIPCIEHPWKQVVEKEATCTETGIEDMRCSVCGTVKEGSKKDIPIIEHSWKQVVEKEATCTETGIEDMRCSVCGTVKEGSKKDIPVIEHQWNKGETVRNATCTDPEEIMFTCLICKTVKNESGNKANHTFSEWETVYPATVFRPEFQQHYCNSCQFVEFKLVGKKLDPVIELNASEILLKVKQVSSALKITKLANGDSVVSWKSSNINIFKVSNSGKLTAGNKAGKAILTIKLKSGLTKEIPVTVQKTEVKTTGITGLAKMLTIEKNKKFVLKPVISPITSVQKVTYASSNKKVATVSNKGVITAKQAGTTKITVKSGSKKFTVSVTVPRIRTQNIAGVSNSVTIKKGKTYTLKAKRIPMNSNDNITYVSSNKKVATVDKNGKIKGIKKGTATITVKSGTVSVKCKVTVE